MDAAPRTAKSKASKRVLRAESSVDTLKAIENTELELEIVSNPKKQDIRISGGLISAVSPLFTKDSKYIFTARSNQIQLWSVTTGECVRILEAHKDAVTSFELNPQNSLQLYSASLDGTIIVWDFQEGTVLRTFDINFPVERLLFCPDRPESLFYVTRHAPKRSKTGFVHRLYHQSLASRTSDLPMDVSEDKPYSPELLLKRFAELADWSIDPHGNLIAGIFDRALVIYWFKEQRVVTYDWVRDFTCVAIHPSEACIATGDCIGQVVLWYYLDAEG